MSQLLTKHQRNQSGKAPKGQAGKTVLSKRQASQILHFQMIKVTLLIMFYSQSNLPILGM